MRQIETLVFDYGGVIVNIDDASVVKAMESLGVTAFKRLIHVRKIKRLMHQYINGLVAEAETLQEMLSLCRKGTSTEDIEKVLEELCGNLPEERLKALVKLRKRYKVNAEAGKRFGFQSVLVKTNHLEEHQEWQEINRI